MNITINEPCHENWDAMTPNQQGAFCKSCQKSVVDFSKKTVAEIKDFFSKPQEGRVCGRFEETQLAELSFDDFFSRFRYWTFSKKFAVIFFMAFGFSLFSNQAVAQREAHMLKGEVAIYDPPKTVTKNPEPKHMVGQTTVKHEPETKQPRVFMGKVKCTNTPTKEKEPAKTKDTIEVKPAVIDEKHAVMGMIAYIPHQQELVTIKNPKPITDVKPVIHVVEEEKIQPADEKKTETGTSVIIYPNPSNGHFTVETKEKQAMRLLDENGKIVLVQEVNGSSTINASHLPAGIYTLTLIGKGDPTIKKIVITR